MAQEVRMRRTKQAFPSAASQSRSKKPGLTCRKSRPRVSPPQPISLYGSTAWEVSPLHGPGADFATSFSGEAPGRCASQVSARTINFAKTARRHERRREHRLNVLRVKASVREIKTDFTFLIGVANAVAFEVIVFMALGLMCYGISSLSVAASL